MAEGFAGLSPHLIVAPVEGDGVFLLSPQGVDVFSGAIFEALVPLLDGRMTLREVVEKVRERFSGAEALYAIEILRRSGHIVESDGLQGGNGAYRSLFGSTWQNLCVSLIKHSSLDAAFVEQAILDNGLREADGAELALVLVDDYLDDRLEALNRDFLRDERPWMIAALRGPILWVGPVLGGADGPCWRCLAERLNLNRPVEKYIETKTRQRISHPPIAASAVTHFRGALVANELTRWAAGGRSSRELVTFEVQAATTERHAVERLPQCPECGQGDHIPTGPVQTNDDSPLAHQDGGLRFETAGQTYERLKRHVSPITGVVSTLSKLEMQDDRIHVFIAGQNFAVTDNSFAMLTRSLRSHSSGKGITEAQARTSALCEGIERYACRFQGYEPYRVSSLDELGVEAIHPNACMLFSERQYDERDRWNARGDHFSWVPRELDPAERLWWSPVWNVQSGEQKYVPTAHIYFHNERLADEVGVSTCAVDSNGNAAGKSYDDAILQGLLELIERDSVALWWYNRSSVPSVDLASFRSDYFDACLDYHTLRGRDMWVLDVTSDLNVPAFVAVSSRRKDNGRIALGFGAHVTAQTAISRAIGELNQFLNCVDNWGPEDATDGTSRWIGSATTCTETYLLPSDEMTATGASTYAQGFPTVKDALEHCTTVVRDQGLDVLVADLTRPDVDLKVVKVIAPGLRHFWARFAPGRLYSVPLRLGRVGRELTEDEFNQTPMFL